MRKTNQSKLQLSTQTIRLLTITQLAAVDGGGTTTTYKVSQGCVSQGCLSEGCVSQIC